LSVADISLVKQVEKPAIHLSLVVLEAGLLEILTTHFTLKMVSKVYSFWVMNSLIMSRMNEKGNGQ
jgi:hypothetical protein